MKPRERVHLSPEEAAKLRTDSGLAEDLLDYLTNDDLFEGSPFMKATIEQVIQRLRSSDRLRVKSARDDAEKAAMAERIAKLEADYGEFPNTINLHGYVFHLTEESRPARVMRLYECRSVSGYAHWFDANGRSFA